MRRPVTRVLIAGIFVLGVLQFHQPDTTNPPSDEASSFETAAKPPHPVASLLKRACYDCHSNQTAWPWYSRVAPVSWMVAQDVANGRSRLNFSEWGRYGEEMSRIRMTEICDEVKSGEMPLKRYVLLHPDAKPSNTEVSALCSQPVAMLR